MLFSYRVDQYEALIWLTMWRPKNTSFQSIHIGVVETLLSLWAPHHEAYELSVGR